MAATQSVQPRLKGRARRHGGGRDGVGVSQLVGISAWAKIIEFAVASFILNDLRVLVRMAL